MWNRLLTKKQLEIAEDIKKKNPRHIILEGAVRSGKTILGIMFWMSLIASHKNKLFIMTGQTISSLKRNVLDEITKMFGIDTHINTNNEWFYNNNKIACFGSDKIDSYKSMRGLTASGWYANEIILSHQNSVLEAFARCSEKEARIIWETNPDKPTHYIKTNYIDRSGVKLEDGSYNIISYHFNLEDNTFLDHNYIESLKVSIPRGTIYDRQILGFWKMTEQAVFNNFDIIQHEPDQRFVNDYCYGLDFGYNNPCALIKIMWIDNELYLKGCFHQTQLKTSEMVERVKEFIFDKAIPIYCDNAEPDKIKALQDAGYNAKPSIKGVMENINKLKEYKIHLVYDITLIQEFENYEFQKNASGEILDIPVKHNDHYVDAVKDAVATHDKMRIKDITESTKVEDVYDKFVP